MSLIRENVIPGNHGKIFGTNAKEERHLLRMQEAIQGLEGVMDCLINFEVFPREFTVHTSEIVSVRSIEDAVISVGFHAIPKHAFPL
jgi:hypothetical protein